VILKHLFCGKKFDCLEKPQQPNPHTRRRRWNQSQGCFCPNEDPLKFPIYPSKMRPFLLSFSMSSLSSYKFCNEGKKIYFYYAIFLVSRFRCGVGCVCVRERVYSGFRYSFVKKIITIYSSFCLTIVTYFFSYIILC